MKWLVRDCRELETVGIQGDENRGGRSRITYMVDLCKAEVSKKFVIMWSKGMEVLEDPDHSRARKEGAGRGMGNVLSGPGNVPTGDCWKLLFLDRR